MKTSATGGGCRDAPTRSEGRPRCHSRCRGHRAHGALPCHLAQLLRAPRSPGSGTQDRSAYDMRLPGGRAWFACAGTPSGACLAIAAAMHAIPNSESARKPRAPKATTWGRASARSVARSCDARCERQDRAWTLLRTAAAEVARPRWDARMVHGRARGR